MNSTAQKNELIFSYSSGNLGDAKNFFISMYLYLNSLAAKRASIFDNILADNFNELEGITPQNINYADCIKMTPESSGNKIINKNPLKNLLGNIENINWKSIYKGSLCRNR
jgi:hypothetical protein